MKNRNNSFVRFVNGGNVLESNEDIYCMFRMARFTRFLLFPSLPLFGTLFVILYFSISLYKYNYPSIEDAKICP